MGRFKINKQLLFSFSILVLLVVVPSLVQENVLMTKRRKIVIEQKLWDTK